MMGTLVDQQSPAIGIKAFRIQLAGRRRRRRRRRSFHNLNC
jgi:hypothetical protein